MHHYTFLTRTSDPGTSQKIVFLFHVVVFTAPHRTAPHINPQEYPPTHPHEPTAGTSKHLDNSSTHYLFPFHCLFPSPQFSLLLVNDENLP